MPTNSALYQRQYRETYTKRYKEVSVSLPLATYEALRAHTKAEGSSLSRFLREAGIAQMEQSQRISPVLTAEISSLRLLLANMGNNLNQLTRYAH